MKSGRNFRGIVVITLVTLGVNAVAPAATGFNPFGPGGPFGGGGSSGGGSGSGGNGGNGNGGNGNGSNGSGGGKNSEAAQLAYAMLFGAAAIIGAMAPMSVAKTQAEADKAIARINSDTQKYLTDKTADTSKYLADQQKSIAEFQSNLARTIAKEQQDNVNYRLNRQLAELKDARLDAQKTQEEIRQKEWDYNERRLRIAEDQAQKNYDLAQEALKAQLTASGLSSGFANSFDSGNQLTTNSSINTTLGGVGGTGAQALTGGATGQAATGQAAAAGVGQSAAAASGTGQSPSLGLGGSAGRLVAMRGAEEPTGGSVLGGKDKGALDRLLGSVGRGAADEAKDESFDEEVARDSKAKKKRRGLWIATKLAASDAKVSAGAPVAKATGRSSDLIKFFGDSAVPSTFASDLDGKTKLPF